MSIIALCKIKVFSRSKELYESNFIFEKIKKITYVILPFWRIIYLILVQMLSYFLGQNNTKSLAPL